MNEALGLSKQILSKNAEKLGHILSDHYFLYLNTLNAHWNVEGSNFIALHKLLEEQYEQIKDYLDEVAERIRTLGFKAPASYKSYHKQSDMDFMKAQSDQGKVIENLCSSYKESLTQLRITIKEISETNDYATEDLLVEILRNYEKNLWMLISHIKITS